MLGDCESPLKPEQPITVMGLSGTSPFCAGFPCPSPFLGTWLKFKLPNGIPERGILMAHSTYFSQLVMTSLVK